MGQNFNSLFMCLMLSIRKLLTVNKIKKYLSEKELISKYGYNRFILYEMKIYDFSTCEVFAL